MCFLCRYPPKILGDVTETTLLGVFISALFYIKVTLKSGGTARNGIDCRKDSPGDIIPSDLYVDEIEVY